RQLPFSELKIDRAYVTDCHRDKVKEGMLESMIALARGFGLKTVAEGIETFHESHKLQGLGVVIGQGFLFAKPMPKDDLLARISAVTGKRRVGQPRPRGRFGAAPPAPTARSGGGRPPPPPPGPARRALRDLPGNGPAPS